jgi:hypothetical protein
VEIVRRIAPAPTERSGVGDPVWGPEEVLFRLDLDEAD